nr:MAG TPA: hypothetical protein [Caudoviricetes sp.]
MGHRLFLLQLLSFVNIAKKLPKYLAVYSFFATFAVSFRQRVLSHI